MDPRPDRGFATLLLSNRHLLWLSILVILVGGVSAALTTPRLEDPRITNRNLLIVTQFPGASAERVEALVTDVIEKALDEIAAIKDITSSSRAGVSTISVEFDPLITEADNDALFAEVRDKVGAAAALLPPEASEPIVDDKRDPVAFTTIYAVTWNHQSTPQAAMLGRLAGELADRIRRVPGTELVRVYGAPDEEMSVTVQAAELAEAGLSPSTLSDLIAAADSKRPSGVIHGDRVDLAIEVMGELDSTQRISSIPLRDSSSGSVLRLGDIAQVSRDIVTPESQIGLLDGRRAVFVAARVKSSVIVDRWAASASATVESFMKGRGDAVQVHAVFEQSPYTRARLTELGLNLFAGAAVIIVVIMFIMGLRSALIVAITLPLSVAAVAFGWKMLGIQIHQMSVFGLILALGLLIDNAIVVTDEVVARRAAGDSPQDAMRHALAHLAGPLFASTLTTVLAFAPITLLPGGPGDFVGSIGVSVILAIIASFAISLTIVAALAALYANPSQKEHRRTLIRDGFAPDWMTRSYRGSLSFLYKHPMAAILIAATPPLAGFAIAPTLGNQFFPPVDRNMFEVRVWMPSGSPAGSTASTAHDIEQSLREMTGVTKVSWMIGGSHPSVFYNLVMDQDRSPNYAQAIVTTTSAAETKRLVQRAERFLAERHPEAQIVARTFAQGPPISADVEFRITGSQTPMLQTLGEQVRAALQEDPDVLLTQATIFRGEPKTFFDVDEDSARLAGLSLTDIASQFEAATTGRVGGSVLEDLEELPVRVRYSDSDRRSPAAIGSVHLTSPSSGLWIAAQSLGSVEVRPEAGAIARFNRERANTIKAYTRDGALPIDVSERVLKHLNASGFSLPPGYAITAGGATEQDAEATQNLLGLVPVIGTLGVATLILVFRSVTLALVLGVVAICSLGLALLSTWSIGFPVSFNTILGTLGLIGVALNDSIVVVASIRAHPTARYGDRKGMVEAVSGCTRHVIATTATTVGGFLPLLLFVGGDFWPSLAIVLVGGIVGASVVALLMVPALYMLMLGRNSVPEGGQVPA